MSRCFLVVVSLVALFFSSCMPVAKSENDRYERVLGIVGDGYHEGIQSDGSYVVCYKEEAGGDEDPVSLIKFAKKILLQHHPEEEREAKAVSWGVWDDPANTWRCAIAWFPGDRP